MNVARIRRESRDRDREFQRDDDRGFVYGVAMGIAFVVLVVGLYRVLA